MKKLYFFILIAICIFSTNIFAITQYSGSCTSGSRLDGDGTNWCGGTTFTTTGFSNSTLKPNVIPDISSMNKSSTTTSDVINTQYIGYTSGSDKTTCVMFWFYTSDNTQPSTVIAMPSLLNTLGFGHPDDTALNTPGRLQLMYSVGSGLNRDSYNSTSPYINISNGIWYPIALQAKMYGTGSRADIVVWVNNTLVYNTSNVGSGVFESGTTYNKYLLGSSYVGTGSSLKGGFDEVVIINGECNTTQRAEYLAEPATANININITYPINYGNYTFSPTINYTLNGTPSACWYSNNSGLTNTSLTCGTNITGKTWVQGTNIVTIAANNSIGNISSSTVTFYLDTIKPSVNISNNYTFCFQETANVSTACGGLDSGSYYRDNGIIDNLVDGDYSTYSTINSCPDTTTGNFYINYTTPSSTVNAIWQVKGFGGIITNYTLPNSCIKDKIQIRVTEVGCNFPLSSTYSCYNGSSWYQISSGSISSSGVNRFYEEAIYLGIGNKQNYVWYNNTPLIYISINDINIDTCKWTNNSGLTNNSINCNAKNISGYTFPEGFNNITIYVNDTFGNNNSDSIVFGVNSNAPVLTITYPINNSGFISRTNTVNYTVTDLNISSCWYSNNSGITNNTLTNCANITGKTWALGNNIINIWANDSANNLAQQTISFRIKNITSNISSYSLRTDLPISVNVTAVGFLSNYTCSAYTNFTNVSCSNSNSGTIVCTSISDFINQSINITPYCVDDELINATTGTAKYKYHYLDNLTINLKDETTGDIITNNITFKMSNNISESTYYITSGQLNLTNIQYGVYHIRLTNTNYTTKTQDLIINVSDSVEVTIYMFDLTTASSTIFTVKDKASGIPLVNALLTTYSFINNSWVVSNTAYTDLTGKTQLYYIVGNNYKFYVSYPGYQDYIFYLTPILYSTYDIYLEQSSLVNFSMNLEGITIISSPQFMYSGINTYNLLFSNPNSTLTEYGYTITYPGGTNSTSANYFKGSQLSTIINISGADINDIVTVNYYYINNISGRRNLTLTIPIIQDSSNPQINNTFMTNKDNTYGLGIFERVLIVTIISIFVLGICVMIGQVLPGFVITIFVLGYMVFIGFIPIWIILPGFFIGFLLLIWRSGGY